LPVLLGVVLTEKIQEVGAYAGLASVVGLAVLSVLYFSQARDVRRLREWAGRAPERAADQAGQQQAVPGVAAQPQPATGATAQPQPGKPGVPAPTQAGAAPAQPGGAPVKPGVAPQPRPGVPAVPTVPRPGQVTAAAGAKPATATPATQGAQGNNKAPTPGVPAVPAKAGVAAAGGVAATANRPPGAPPVPAAAGQTQARPAPGGRPPSATAIIPPGEQEEPWYRRLVANPRYLALLIAGILIVGGGAAFGIVQLTKEDSQPTQAGAPSSEQTPADNGDENATPPSDKKKQPRINPADVKVAVLNGTTVPGLAARVGDKLENLGFQVPVVDNSGDQATAESIVMFADGHEREAIAVGRRLKIPQRQPVSAAVQGLAGEATVVVVTGADQS
jgi:hypothetical protein